MIAAFKKSAFELKSVRNLCIVSILIALKIIVGLIGTIKISDFLVVGFGFLVYLIVGTMFGPLVSILFGFLSDILTFYISWNGRAPFHWGFTLSSIISVLIYGLFLYKFKLSIGRVLVCQIVHDIIVLWILNTYWLSQMYFKNDFVKAFSVRFIKEIITLPVNCFLAVSLAVVFSRVAKGLKFV